MPKAQGRGCASRSRHRRRVCPHHRVERLQQLEQHSAGQTSGPPSAQPDRSAPTVALPPPPTEGCILSSSGSVARYSNGTVIRLAALHRRGNSLSSYINSRGQSMPLPADRVIVQVILSVQNKGSSPVDGFDLNTKMQLLYGHNRSEAPLDPGNYVSTNPSMSTLTIQDPTQLAPGATALTSTCFDVPTTEVATLAVLAEVPGAYPPYTFSDAQNLLRQ